VHLEEELLDDESSAALVFVDVVIVLDNSVFDMVEG
jgi:hypothetical protein